MRLQHLNLLRPVQYPVASSIQEAIVRWHIDFGLLKQSSQQQQPAPPVDRQIRASAHLPDIRSPPQPVLLTFQTTPTYTCGRREIAGITPERIEYLTASGRAAFHTALRGGQTTFHGPGQVTAYLVLSLREHGLTPRCYVRFLEDCVIRLCAALGVPTVTTEDPGVWLAEPEAIGDGGKAWDNADGQVQERGLVATDSKICAVGVHMRRGVTSHGLGLNVNPDLAWFERIVACGLVGKRVTSIEQVGVQDLGVRKVSAMLAEFVARGLKGIDGIDTVELEGNAEQDREYPAPPIDG